MRLHSSAAVCFRPLLLWDVTQHWLSVNLEDRTNRPSRNIDNQLPTKAMHHTGRVRAQGFGSSFRNHHLTCYSAFTNFLLQFTNFFKF